MTLAAVRKRFGEVCAAIPLGALFGIRCEALIWVEDERPEDHQPALVVGEPKCVLGAWGSDRREAEEIRLDRQDILIREVGVAGVRECGIEPGAVARDPLVHGSQE